MFSNSLVLFASIAAASALAVGPTPASLPQNDAGSTVTVCSAVNPLAGCINIPINSDDCHSFTGGFSFLNDEVSAAIVPAGFICTFFDAAGCLSTTDTDVVFLQGGTYSFLSVPGIFGNVNFNDRASSFTCSTF
ncbi:hypothetical protein C8J57DRAFT_1570023 [Mycena rebaudengoi]|nr:hypothetical protein C8J57DRAFT_1570023 [Mycena rebaudengoi]